jgi:hypothetical protein
MSTHDDPRPPTKNQAIFGSYFETFPDSNRKFETTSSCSSPQLTHKNGLRISIRYREGPHLKNGFDWSRPALYLVGKLVMSGCKLNLTPPSSLITKMGPFWENRQKISGRRYLDESSRVPRWVWSRGNGPRDGRSLVPRKRQLWPLAHFGDPYGQDIRTGRSERPSGLLNTQTFRFTFHYCCSGTGFGGHRRFLLITTGATSTAAAIPQLI